MFAKRGGSVAQAEMLKTISSWKDAIIEPDSAVSKGIQRLRDNLRVTFHLPSCADPVPSTNHKPDAAWKLDEVCLRSRGAKTKKTSKKSKMSKVRPVKRQR
jgi:hypothetical protein